MALSYYSNWEAEAAAALALHQDRYYLNYPESMSSILPPQPQPADQLDPPYYHLNFHDNFTISDTCIDHLFHSDNLFFYPEENYLEMFPSTDQFEPFPSSTKRPKPTYDDNYHFYTSDFSTTPPPPPLGGFVPNPNVLPELCLPLTELSVPLPDLHVQSPEFQSSTTSAASSTTAPATLPMVVYNHGTGESGTKKAGGGTLSAQSMAARVRRRKITEKTQELGKLIPGGQKMNTAEMFQAASKYIKFMQAQVGILEFMGEAVQENEEPFHSEELHHLFGSPLVQEKLYSAEKCLVPKRFVETLVNDPKIQSKPQVMEGISQLLQTCTSK